MSCGEQVAEAGHYHEVLGEWPPVISLSLILSLYLKAS